MHFFDPFQPKKIPTVFAGIFPDKPNLNLKKVAI